MIAEKQNKRVLIITYYWPPSGGAGVQRWLKFTKYLRNYGWEPIIYTPQNPEAPTIDGSLAEDIPPNVETIKTPIWEPYNAYKKLIGQKKEEKVNAGFLSEKKKPKLTEKISVWVRGNWFIPDARKFWIKPSIKFLSDYLQKNTINAIVSTGPPHSMHIIALRLKEKFNMPWLADFRDPWTNIDFYKDLMLTKWADNKHHKLEKQVLQKADKVLVISPSMINDFEQLHKRKYTLITNGYDESDVVCDNIVALDKKFSIAHIGTMVKTRNPENLWQALQQLCKESDSFSKSLEIKLVGSVDASVHDALSKYQLTDKVNRIKYIPHDEVISIQKATQVLLLLINNSPNAKMVLTGKFFEYMAAKRPILCIGPKDGNAADILKKTNTGTIFDYNEVNALKKQILNYYNLYKSNQLYSDAKNIDMYSRNQLTKQLANELNTIGDL